MRGHVYEIAIGCGSEEITRYRQSYDKVDMVFDPLHFLPLLERKIDALDQAFFGKTPHRGLFWRSSSLQG